MNKVVSEIDYDKEPVEPASDLPEASLAPEATESGEGTDTDIANAEQDPVSETASDDLSKPEQTFTTNLHPCRNRRAATDARGG